MISTPRVRIRKDSSSSLDPLRFDSNGELNVDQLVTTPVGLKPTQPGGTPSSKGAKTPSPHSPGFLTCASADGLLGLAKSHNLIAICSPCDDITKISSEFLMWAAENLTTGQVSIMVVLSDIDIDGLAIKLAVKSRLRVAACHPSVDAPDLSLIRVVVCSVDTLLSHLTRGVWTIAYLSAFVITDARSALRDGQPLADVLGWFCRSPNIFMKPRILAFSPPMTHPDIKTMERLLLAETVYSAPKRLCPLQVVIGYDPTHTKSPSKLTQNIRLLDPSGNMCEPLFKDADCVSQQLGSCASDLVWRRALKDRVFCGHDEDNSVEERITKVLKLVEHWDFSMPNANTSSRGFNLTSKFTRLIQLLRAYGPCGDDFRGIVLVRQGCVAVIMADMLRVMTYGLEFLRPIAVTGCLPVANLQYQIDIRRSFETGKCNLLILTKTLEDLDLPPALLVIRFDAFESQLSYSHACVHACLPSSRLVHMVENGNDVHRQMLSRFSEAEFDERWIPVIIHNGGVPIPPSPLVKYRPPSQYGGDDETASSPYIEDPITGRRLYEHDALEALYCFIAVVQKDSVSGAPLLVTAEFAVSEIQQAWVCTVTLPVDLPFKTVTGPARFTPTHARRSAALETCVQLYEHGMLHINLFPVRQPAFKLDTASPVPVAAEKVSGNRSYTRKRTHFWFNSIRLHRRRLFPFVVYVDQVGLDYAPIMLLTRQPLPHIPSFRIFFPGMSETIRSCRAPPLEVDGQSLEALHLFTVRICRAISNKPLACNFEKMAYLFAPLKLPEQVDIWTCDLTRLTEYISWDTIALAGRSWMVKINIEELRTSSEAVHDLIVQDRLVEFTRRYFVARLRQDLTPLSKPEDSPREEGYANLVEYCKARRKCFDGLSDYSQPLLEVSGVATTGNHLNPTTKAAATESAKAAVKYLIPELSVKFTVPASTFRTALLLPSIMKRIEDFLIVHELNASLFNHSIDVNYLLSAISTPSAGFEVDYERLEFFGDSFLKYLASVYVFVDNPVQHEGALHAARQRIISNKVLMQCADQIGLPQYIQSKAFSHKLWYPPNFNLDPLSLSSMADPVGGGDENGLAAINSQGKQDSTSQDEELNATSMPKKRRRPRDDDTTQWLGDKTIADVAEAIIGAAYMSGGQDSALQAAKALHVPIPLIQQWQDLRRKAAAMPSTPSRPLRQGTIESVEAIIGHRFRCPHLLAQALTHASVEGYDATCYERLEFLGDAILDFLTVRYIFHREDCLSPGAMSMLKGTMVSNAALAALCVSCGLHKHLHFDSYALATAFEAYAQQMEAKRLEVEEAATEDNLPKQHWLQVEPPKALSDIVESIIGAIYVSDGFTMDGVEKFFEKVLKPFYDRHITLKTLSHHPTTVLFELLQSHGCQQFELVKERNDLTQETRCDCVLHQITLASAARTTAQAAGRAASVLALDALQCNPELLSRTCDCREGRGSSKGAQVRIKKMLVEEMEDGNRM